MSLRRFPPAHPVMCAMLLHACFAMMCVTHKPLGFWRHQHFCVFCVYDLHQPLSYGCWYEPVGTLQFSQPEGMSRIYVIHQPLGYWCRARSVGMLCIYVFHKPLGYRCWLWPVGIHYFILPVGSAPFLWLCACCWLVAAQGRHAQTNAGHSRTRDPRKHHTFWQARNVQQHKQTGKHKNRGKVRVGRCRVRANRKAMQCKHLNQAKCHPRECWMMARTSTVCLSGRGSYPKTWVCCCQARNRFLRPWLQNVSARAILIGMYPRAN